MEKVVSKDKTQQSLTVPIYTYEQNSILFINKHTIKNEKKNCLTSIDLNLKIKKRTYYYSEILIRSQENILSLIIFPL